MKRNVYYFLFNFLILISIVLISMCNQKNNNSFITPKILISEPFINRVDDNFEDHDINCMGFITNQFQPSIFDTSFFYSRRISLLKKLTGLKWQTFSTTDSVINFNHIFSAEDDTNRVVFVAELIKVDSAEEKILSIGSDDGFKLWVNGDSIACMHKGRQLLPHDDIIQVRLRKGKNVFLYKIDQGTGDWALFRKFITVNQLHDIIIDNVSEMYSDIPESCILPDSAAGFLVNPENGRSLDKWHIVKLIWKDFNHFYPFHHSTYKPIDLPDFIYFPKQFNGKAIFEIQVFKKDGNIIFKEAIPIMYESMALNMVQRLTRDNHIITDPIYLARKEAVISLFSLHQNNKNKYSTRMKAHAILDLFQYIQQRKKQVLNHQVPQIWGYYSEIDTSIQPFRIFIPAPIYSPKSRQSVLPVVFLMRWIVEKEIDNNYWTSQQFQSHWRTVKRAAHCTAFQTVLVMPFGRGYNNYLGNALEEFPLIIKQLESKLFIDRNHIGLFAHSNAPMLAIELLRSQKLPVSYLGFWSPILPDDETVAYSILLQIKNNYPKLKWYIWQGAEDEKAKVSVTRRWVDMIRKIPFEVKYFEEPHSTHFVYLGDPEKEFIKIIKKLSRSYSDDR